MVMVLLPPERLSHLLGRFRNVLSKPQFENFRSVMFGLIMSGCKEHDVKSMRDTVGETKCQSSINRFFTSPSWNLDNVMKCAQEIIFSTVRHDDNLEFLIIDDTVCKKKRWCAIIIRQCLELCSVMIMLQAFTCAEISVFHHHRQGCTVNLRSVMRKACRSGRRFSCATRL